MSDLNDYLRWTDDQRRNATMHPAALPPIRSEPSLELPEDVRLFIYKVTLHLQLSRSKTPEQNDAMFHEAYRLYSKYDVEGLRRAEEAGRNPDLTVTGSPSGSVASKEAGR